MRKTVVSLLFILALAALDGGAARAQSSFSETLPPREAYARSALVFVGTVRTAGQVFAMTNMGRVQMCVVSRPTRFAVVKSFYGSPGAEVSLDDAYTSFDFKEGETYLVYAFRDARTGELVTADRMRTRPVAEAGEDFNFLEKDAGRAAGVSFVGKVTRKGRPLAGVRLQLSGGGREYEVLTDAGGEYAFAGLAAGEYRLRVRLSWTLLAEGAERVVRVADRGSVREDFVVRSSILWLR